MDESDWRDWLIAAGITLCGIAITGTLTWYALGAMP